MEGLLSASYRTNRLNDGGQRFEPAELGEEDLPNPQAAHTLGGILTIPSQDPYGTASVNPQAQTVRIPRIMPRQIPDPLQETVSFNVGQGSSVRVSSGQLLEIEFKKLLGENLLLHDEVRKLHKVIQNSKLETADQYANFGRLAEKWAETVRELNDLNKNQRDEYERRIAELEKTNRQLVKENKEMKKVIDNLTKMKVEFEKQKKALRLGQIGYQLDTLVSEYVFPGDDEASKRARYGAKLKSLKGKIDKLKDTKLQQTARVRLGELDPEMFEDWFLGIVDEIKKSRIDTAHPDLGSYDEMKEIVNDEFKDDDVMRADMLKALERLKKMYRLLNRTFGK